MSNEIKQTANRALGLSHRQGSAQRKFAHGRKQGKNRHRRAEYHLQELEKEDLLDEKVKEILKDKLNEIRNSNIDYYEMFRMVKSKLAEQENIVL